MKFVELIFIFKENTEIPVDIFIAQLTDVGFDGFWEEKNKLMAYMPFTTYNNRLIENCSIYKEHKSLFTVKENIIEDTNWNELWESNFELVSIKNCCIRAPFHNKPTEIDIKYDIIIEPKMSFGTGHHETTSMVVDMMLGLDFYEKKVLDMGSGTGVLAILAAMKNAAYIDAVDNDIWSFNNATENIKRNNVAHINVVHGDMAVVKDNQYNIILANITRNILLEYMPFFSEMQTANDIIILSGFLKQDVAILEKKAQECHYKLKNSLLKNNWAALELFKL